MDFSLLNHPDVSITLLNGFKFTLTVTILSIMGGILLGTPLAMMRLSKNVLASKFAKFYVDFFRGVPLIQVIFIFYYQNFLISKPTLIMARYFQVLSLLLYLKLPFSLKSYVQEFSPFQQDKAMQAMLWA